MESDRHSIEEDLQMTNKNWAIGILSVIATILFVGLMIISTGTPQNAYAVGQNGAGGDYLACTSQLDESTEVIYILDAGVGRLNVYGFNINTGRTELIQSMNVQAPERGREPQGPQGQQRR